MIPHPRPVPLVDTSAPAWRARAAWWAAQVALPAGPVVVPGLAVARPTTHSPRDVPPDPFLASIAARLDAAGNAPLDLSGELRGERVLDVEVFRNFFVACLMDLGTGAVRAFEHSERAALDRRGLAEALRGGTVYTFNGASYDMPVVALALAGADCARLYEASGRIIGGRMRPWQVEREFGVRLPRCDHVDLMEVAPGVGASLKIVHGRLHGRYLVDLPFAPDAELTPRQMNVATLYCLNDLEATAGLRRALAEPLEMRAALGREAGLDLRSKSDAQVGEALVRRRVERALGWRVEAPPVAPRTFRYVPPDFVSFASDDLRRALAEVAAGEFRADEGGTITPPRVLQDLVVRIGEGEYRMGTGGLHSSEAHRALRADDERLILDADVTGYYPNIILRVGMYPQSAGPAFLDVYRGIVAERAAAKARAQAIEDEIKRTTDAEVLARLRSEREPWKVRAEGGKISANGVFGKLGSSYSFMYAPDLLVATTLTGQLSLMMLVERAEAAGIPVASANTDGVVFYCPRQREATLGEVLAEWEAMTDFALERTRYRALYSSSVNTYLALKEGGGAKWKGPPADPWGAGDVRGQLSKNPQMTVLSRAVERLAADGTPVAETIAAERDPRAFVTLIRVTGGAEWRGQRLGRAVRYYWSTRGEPITTAGGARRVAKTEGAAPLMELTDALPPDLDRARYAREAERLARDLAVAAAPEGLLEGL